MSENWVDGFKGALLRYVQVVRPEAVEVLSWEEDITRDIWNGCDTCGFGADEPYVLMIRYRTADDYSSVYSSTTPFGELFSALLEQEN